VNTQYRQFTARKT